MVDSRLSVFCSILLPLLLSSILWTQNQPSQVAPSAARQSDGPAELPRVYISSGLSDSPAPGHVIQLRSGDNLQQALDKANCGDTIKLEAGGVFRGQIHFPQKPCDDAHWIIVRTTAPDQDLPPEGMRITPCYAGVASLPARPDFHCSSPRNVMAKIEYDSASGSGPLAFMPGANHYRFIGLELTRGAPGASITALGFAKEGTAHHLIFDRVWMHGTAQDETTRGLAISGMTYVAVVDSFFTDFHCVAVSGSCTDAQTISGGGGNEPGGPYKIVNNFLEASGENLLFGGGPATATPADIEIRGNYLFKPMSWKPGASDFVGGLSGRPFIVKNHFELKNAQRVLFEGNQLENVWGGFSQTGFSILLTPKNQNNRCPLCRVNDVTIRYNKISNVGSGLQIANDLSDAGGASSGGERYSIHDLVLENVHAQDYGGFGLFAIIISSGPPLRDISIEHVTAFVPRAIFSILNTKEKLANFTIRNNIFYSGGERQVGSAGGGPRNCAFQPDAQGPSGVLKSCFDNLVFNHNLVIGGGGWPRDNITVKDMRHAGFREVRDQGASDYRLCRQKDDSCKEPSRAVGAASDGKDIGADIDAIEKAIAGKR
jgi:hypothetical protein